VDHGLIFVGDNKAISNNTSKDEESRITVFEAIEHKTSQDITQSMNGAISLLSTPYSMTVASKNIDTIPTQQEKSMK
jgi:uncharacterized protein (DUF2384 family)